MEIPEYLYIMALQVRLFAWHLGQENNEEKHTRKKISYGDHAPPMWRAPDVPITSPATTRLLDAH